MTSTQPKEEKMATTKKKTNEASGNVRPRSCNTKGVISERVKEQQREEEGKKQQEGGRGEAVED